MYADTSSHVSGESTGDDFDWLAGSEDEDNDQTQGEEDKPDRPKLANRRGRWLYYQCMMLPRALRVFLMIFSGVFVCMIPITTIEVGFPDYSGRMGVDAWCGWAAAIWACTCMTFFGVDVIAAIIIRIAVAVWGKAPGLVKKVVQILMGTALYIKIVLSVSWAWVSLRGLLDIAYGPMSNVCPYWEWILVAVRAIFTAALVLLIEKTLLQLIALNFHETAVKDRLHVNQHALKVVDTLFDATRTSRLARTFRSNSGNQSSSGLVRCFSNLNRSKSQLAESGEGRRNHLHRSESSHSQASHHHLEKAVSAETLLDTHVDESPSGPTYPPRQSARKARKAKMALQLNELVAMTSLSPETLYKSRWASQDSARRVARRLFLGLAPQRRKTLTAEDFLPYFDSKAEADDAFGVFDQDGSGKVCRKEMRRAVQQIYRERRALNAGLKDIRQAIDKVDKVLLFAAFLVCLFLWYLIFNRSTDITALMPFRTLIISISFIFGRTFKEIFQSMIFIFASHPYDAGDMVCIDGTWMWVKEFGILSTTFRTPLNEYVVAPNPLLAGRKYIYNARRSGNMVEVIRLTVGYTTTTLAMIDSLRAQIDAFVKANEGDFGGSIDLNISQIQNQNEVTIMLAFDHLKGAYQDWGARWKSRTMFMRRVRELCTELGMQYEMAPQPIRLTPTTSQSWCPGDHQPRLPMPGAPMPGLAAGTLASYPDGRAPFVA